MVTFISHSPLETEALGVDWGRAAQPGLVIALSGDLGAGKTQLVKGIARGLEVPGRIHSPTFSLINIYEGGRLPLYHIDLYRLDTPEQIAAAGLEEYLSTRGLTVIEWAEKWFSPPRSLQGKKDAGQIPGEFHRGLSCPPGVRWGEIESLGGTERRITYEDTRD
jgi:tRNA threonylcarbamoyladenosine biosynthesis protein TsaE